jgi:7-cyano-7-deazaguanine synthase
MKAIILLSGGLDSAVAAAWAKKHWDRECVALSFWYEQRHVKELECASKLSRYYGWRHRGIDVHIPAKSALIGAGGDVNEMVKGLPASFVPGRNMIFLGLAASLAYTLEVDNIVGGWNHIDYSGYPDCRPEFLTSMQDTINFALGFDYQKVTIQAPLIALNKKEIILMGHELKVPFGMTWSCYEGKTRPCGVCGSCQYRQKGFLEAGIEDK